MCGNPKNHILCFKPLKILLTKCGSSDICKENQVLFVDEWPTKHAQNCELTCIFPFSYMD